MRDDLSHIRNLNAQKRDRKILEHKQALASLYKQYPDLKDVAEAIESVKRQLMEDTIARFRGQDLATDVVALENELSQLLNKRQRILDSHGIAVTALAPDWDCKKCEDTGRIFRGENNVESCSCLLTVQAEFRKKTIGLPERLVGSAFDQVNFNLYPEQKRVQAKKVFAYAKTYCENLQRQPRGQGLYIHGGTGSGKSFLLGCIANYLSDHLGVKYLVYADYLDALRATYGSKDNELEQELIHMVKQVDLLMLDDLGLERPTEFSLNILAQIVDYRYRNLKPIIVTSNFTLKELEKRAKNDLNGERIVWRLFETCQTLLVLDGNIRLNM